MAYKNPTRNLSAFILHMIPMLPIKSSLATAGSTWITIAPGKLENKLFLCPLSLEPLSGLFCFIGSWHFSQVSRRNEILRNGGPSMTNLQKDQIIAMREQKVTYATISETLGIPIGTIKTFCRRNSMTTARTLSNAYWTKPQALKAIAFKAKWLCSSARISGKTARNPCTFRWNAPAFQRKYAL